MANKCQCQKILRVSSRAIMWWHFIALSNVFYKRLICTCWFYQYHFNRSLVSCRRSSGALTQCPLEALNSGPGHCPPPGARALTPLDPSCWVGRTSTRFPRLSLIEEAMLGSGHFPGVQTFAPSPGHLPPVCGNDAAFHQIIFTICFHSVAP